MSREINGKKVDIEKDTDEQSNRTRGSVKGQRQIISGRETERERDYEGDE